MTYRGQKGTRFVCSTIGELKAAIADMPDDIRLECEMESAVEIMVYQHIDDPDDVYLDIVGSDLDDEY